MLRPEDFPEELRNILGTQAGAHDSADRQPVCKVDARITPQIYDPTNELPGHVRPQVEGQSETVMPWRIRNGHRGDVMLCPGGPSGMIGSMLSALSPSQDYSHCGLVIDDGRHIRHCTTTDERLEMYPLGSIAGIDVPAPIDGFQENALRFGWPGTLTQTVQDAWFFSQNFKPSEGYISDPDLPTSDNNRFWIHALSFVPKTAAVDQSGSTWRIIWPVLVKPCFAGIDDQHMKEVVDALDRVATVAESLRGHYRTFAYTDANARGGPPMPTVPPLPSDSTVLPAGSQCDGAGGSRVAPAATFGYMCSSFIWHAVQGANLSRPAGVKRILLDGRPDGIEPGARCDRTSEVERSPYGPERFDAATLDGLYFYDETQRQRAAQALQKAIHIKVYNAIEKMLPAWLVLGGAGASMSLPQLLAAVGAGPLAGIAGLLAISPALLTGILLGVERMPESIANQVGSSFAKDDNSPTAASDTDWLERPGVGRTVSPDDILHNWASPTKLSADLAADNLLGLYGRNVRLVLDPPMFRQVPVPPITWQISQGFGVARGSVFYRTGALDVNGQPVKVPLPQARVRIGPMLLLTSDHGTFLAERVPSGRYWLEAEFEDDATGLMYTYPGDSVEVPLNGAFIRDIELTPPPQSSREVVVLFKADLLHRKLMPWESAWRRHEEIIRGPGRLGLEFFPNTPEFRDDYERATHHVFGWSSDIDGAAIVDVLVDVRLQADGSLLTSVRARMRDADTKFEEDDTVFDESNAVIMPRLQTLKQYGADLLGQFSKDFQVQSDRSGVLPSHAWVEIQVLNLRG